MNSEDKERFLANVQWFNEFFEHLKALFEFIGDALSNEFPVEVKLFYHPKFNFQPRIPPYYMMGMGGEEFAVQVFALLDPVQMEIDPHFDGDPSLIFVKHSRGDKSDFLREYGLTVIRGNGIKIERLEETSGVLAGTIHGNQTRFRAFQVDLGEFSCDREVREVVEEKVLQTMRNLPSW